MLTDRQEEMIYYEGYRRGLADAEPKWIPCSERLPEKGDYVLVTLSDGYVYVGFLSDVDGWWWYLDDDTDLKHTPIYYEVLAWMPLPEPWKGADDEVR